MRPCAGGSFRHSAPPGASWRTCTPHGGGARSVGPAAPSRRVGARQPKPNRADIPNRTVARSKAMFLTHSRQGRGEAEVLTRRSQSPNNLSRALVTGRWPRAASPTRRRWRGTAPPQPSRRRAPARRCGSRFTAVPPRRGTAGPPAPRPAAPALASSPKSSAWAARRRRDVAFGWRAHQLLVISCDG